MREGVTLLTAAEYKQMIRKVGFQQNLDYLKPNVGDADAGLPVQARDVLPVLVFLHSGMFG